MHSAVRRSASRLVRRSGWQPAVAPARRLSLAGRSAHGNAFPASASPTLSATLGGVATPATRGVLVYGGGSLGLLHAALMQMRRQAAEKQQQRTKGSSDDPAASSAIPPPPLASAVCVITSQADLAAELSQRGCRVSFLRTFVSGAASEWLPPLSTGASDSDSHVEVAEPIRIPAATSALSDETVPPPSHILITVKGRTALDRATDEMYAIGKAQLMQQWHHSAKSAAAAAPTSLFTKASLPIVCLLMNGLGHSERVLHRLELKLAHDGDFSPAGAQAARAAFAARLYLATTTSGAKLDKAYSSTTTGTPRISLHLRQGGVGLTTVIQNLVDAKRSRWRSVQAAEDTDGMVALDGSHSLVALFQSIGLPCRLAPAASAATILYTKLLINCAINPLTALHHCRNGQLVQPEFTRRIVGIVGECVGVLARMGVQVDDYPEEYDPKQDRARQSDMWPTNLHEFFPTSTDHAPGPAAAPSEEAMARGLFHVYRTIARTAHNYSSMYADLHPNGDGVGTSASSSPRRPLSTEIECITGHLLEKARELDMPPESLPFNREMYERVLAAERRGIQ